MYRIKIVAVMWVLVVLIASNIVLASPSSSLDRSSVTLVNVVLPTGSYRANLLWGDASREEIFESRGEPLTIRLDVDRVNLRRPILIKVTGDGVAVIEMSLRPSPFGYEVESLKIDPRVRFIDLSRAVYINELVTTANASVKWSSDKAALVKNILVNGLKPLNVEIRNDSVRVFDFVVDERVVLEVEFDTGWVGAEFRLTTEGLHATSKFAGSFSSAAVEYRYSLKRVSWYVALPITREENSTILLQDYGYVESGRGTKPYTSGSIPYSASITPQLSNEVQTIETQTPLQEQSDLPHILDSLNQFKSELLLIGGLIVLAGLIRRKSPIAIVGIVMIALLLVFT